jgi:hypothetical protein
MFRRLPTCHVPGYAPLCLDSNDPDTVQCAFFQRLLREVPEFDPDLLQELSDFVATWLKDNIQAVRALSYEEWKLTTSYNQARLEQLDRAYESLRGGLPTRRQCRHIDTFVKSECYAMWKHARMINSRSDYFKVFSGPLIKAIEGLVYHHPAFIKHVPVCDRAVLIAGMRRAGMRYFATDYTAFESHFIPEIMNALELQLYGHCLVNYPASAKLLCDTLRGKNEMRTRTGLRATCRGRRMSGDMCTSLGNGFTNLMLTLFVVNKLGGEVTGFVEGDDGIFASNVEIKPHHYAALGFTIKIEEFIDPCVASFCGLIFASNGEIIREPRHFLQTFGWTGSFIHGKEPLMWALLKAKALSALCETPQCPIVAALAHRALKECGDVAPRFVEDGYHVAPPEGFEPPVFDPSPDTRALFAEKYGVSADTQLLIEQAIMAGNFNAVRALIPPTTDQEQYYNAYLEYV